MLSITLAQLKADITPKLKGTSLREVKDFYGAAFNAASRMLARIDPQETIRTVTMTTPFFDNVNDYVLVSDIKRMLDIRQQADRLCVPGRSHYSETQPRQFLENLDANTYNIRYNNMVRTLRAQKVRTGNSIRLDSFDGASANGLWTATVDASGLYTEPLNFVEGNGALGFNLSGATGVGGIVNTTASVTDLSSYLYEDTSTYFVWIPIGSSSRITNLELRRGTSAAAYRTRTVTSKADGTAFSDGWNMIRVDWILGSTVGSPTNTLNTYRVLNVTYNITGANVGIPINGFLVDNWTNSLGTLSEIEYYSECLFRSATGTWKYRPTDDTDLVNVGTASYQILQSEMMVDITQIIRIGAVRQQELADWREMLNGQPPNRYIKDPQYRGLYADYVNKFPSSAIVQETEYYHFDV